MITKNYIKMCEKAKEIQDNWIPKSGDEFAYTSDNVFSENFGIYLGNIKYSLTGKDKHFIRDIGGITKPSNMFDQDKYIWLPTQEDLQDMIKNSVPLGLIKVLYYQVYEAIGSKINFDYYSKFKSMLELWLAFMYKEEYSKEWSIGKEDWIKL